ncbi:MAG: hypothetical protein ABI315_05500 [Bacteroidia bacterium]
MIFISAFYLIATSGLTFNLHYCGSKIKIISFNIEHNEDGCCINKTKNKGYCNDKIVSIKIKCNYQHATFLKHLSDFF